MHDINLSILDADDGQYRTGTEHIESFAPA